MSEKKKIAFRIFNRDIDSTAFDIALTEFINEEIPIEYRKVTTTWRGDFCNQTEKLEAQNATTQTYNGSRYLMQLLVMLNASVKIEGKSFTHNVIELSSREIVNKDHNYMGRVEKIIKAIRL